MGAKEDIEKRIQELSPSRREVLLRLIESAAELPEEILEHLESLSDDLREQQASASYDLQKAHETITQQQQALEQQLRDWSEFSLESAMRGLNTEEEVEYSVDDIEKETT